MRKALIVGINKYKSSSDLRGCENDAKAIREILRVHSNDDLNFTIIQPTENIETKVGLLKEIKNLFSGSLETDIALLYFSGHGGSDNKDGFIVTSDGKTSEEIIYMQEILKEVNPSKCRNRIVILDCCHAGNMGNIKFTSNATTAVLYEGVTILAASKSDELSLERDGQGVFTSLLVEALSGGATDLTGYVTAGGAYAYIDKALGPCGQRPVFKTNTAQFLPLRKSNPPIDVRILRKISNYFPMPTDEYSLNPSFEFTNVKGGVHRNQEPYANAANVAVFKDLQALNRVGLVSPNCDDLPPEERHMYFAAMESKSCKLTTIGRFYWKLAKENKI